MLSPLLIQSHWNYGYFLSFSISLFSLNYYKHILLSADTFSSFLLSTLEDAIKKLAIVQNVKGIAFLIWINYQKGEMSVFWRRKEQTIRSSLRRVHFALPSFSVVLIVFVFYIFSLRKSISTYFNDFYFCFFSYVNSRQSKSIWKEIKIKKQERWFRIIGVFPPTTTTFSKLKNQFAWKLIARALQMCLRTTQNSIY